MNYSKHYNNLIVSRQNMNRIKVKYDGLEKHHIVPKSLGGNNKKSNLIYLTPREHFIAHLLLTKMYTGKEKAKMCYALLRMTMCNNTQQRITTSHQFETARLLVIENCIGENHSGFGSKMSDEDKANLSEKRKGTNNPMWGVDPWNKGETIETNDMLREKAERWHENKKLGKYDNTYKSGPKHTESSKQKISEVHKGKPKSAEHRKKLSDAQKGRKRDPIAIAKSIANRKTIILPLLICPHCGKHGRGSSMIRWHFDNCRHITTSDDQNDIL